MAEEDKGDLIYTYQVYLNKKGGLIFESQFYHEVPTKHKLNFTQTLLIISACLEGLGEGVKKFSQLFTEVFEEKLKKEIQKATNEQRH